MRFSFSTSVAVSLLSVWPALAQGQEPFCSKTSSSPPINESSPCSVQSNTYDFCCLPGLAVANATVSDGTGETVTWTASSLEITQNYNRNTWGGSYLTEASYIGLGNMDQTIGTDQYNTGGSTLPLPIKNITSFTGAWTVQVPTVSSSDHYRVYIEMFLSAGTAGDITKGNITIDFYSPGFGYDNGSSPIYTVDLLGCNNLKVADYGTLSVEGVPGACVGPYSQGPFLDFVFPKGTYVPDNKGVLTIPGVDINAVLQWAINYNKNYYSGSSYLSDVNFAQEVSAVDGTFKTTFASFALQASGESVVYTPTWTKGLPPSPPTGSKTCGDGTYWSGGVDDPATNVTPYGGSVSNSGCGTAGGSSGGTSSGSSSGASSGGGHSASTGGAGTSSGGASASSGGASASSGGASASSGSSTAMSAGSSSGGSTGSAAISSDPSAPTIAQAPKLPENVGACGATGSAETLALLCLAGLAWALKSRRARGMP